MMKKFLILLFFALIHSETLASFNENVIQNLKSIDNVSFNFEQNINGKTEKGNCYIEYPKKIYCEYDLGNKKILVSNGKSLVIKTKTSFYLYPLEKTPLNLILDKGFLINKISSLEGRLIDNKYINYNFLENDNEINIFFDKKNFNFIGWQTLDIYQNLSITFLTSIIKNQNLNKNLFSLPGKN